MNDREKVIRGISICLDRFHCNADCPYYDSNTGCMEQLRDDALAMLKEQEPKRGRWVRLTGMAPPEYHGHKICSVCECFAPYDPLHPWQEVLTKYCPGCGAEMEDNEVE